MKNAWYKLLDDRTALLFYAIGFWLLVLVFLAPDAGYVAGKSFFDVAEASPWDRWWDWAAAWCSVKVILLSAGAGSVLAAMSVLLTLLHRESLARAVLLLMVAPLAGVCAGVFFLVKAVL